jgi:hypothetical protein
MRMRLLTAGWCVVVGLGLGAAPAFAQTIQGAASPAPEETYPTLDRTDTRAPAADFAGLREIAEDEGRVRAIVGLRVAFAPEGTLSETRRDAQHGAIADATEAVRDALHGTPHRVIHTYRIVPFIAVELSPAALDKLEAAGVAATLDEDVARAPTLGSSTGIVEAKESWTVGRAGNGWAVAVLDTGVQRTHPFLQHSASASKVLSEACYSGGGDCPGGATSSTAAGSGAPCTYAPDGCRHGTHVAGIAAGKGSTFSGVARGARLISINVFSRFDGPASCPPPGEDR